MTDQAKKNAREFIIMTLRWYSDASERVLSEMDIEDEEIFDTLKELDEELGIDHQDTLDCIGQDMLYTPHLKQEEQNAHD